MRSLVRWYQHIGDSPYIRSFWLYCHWIRLISRTQGQKKDPFLAEKRKETRKNSKKILGRRLPRGQYADMHAQCSSVIGSSHLARQSVSEIWPGAKNILEILWFFRDTLFWPYETRKWKCVPIALCCTFLHIFTVSVLALKKSNFLTKLFLTQAQIS